MMKFQLNIQITGLHTKHLTDANLREGLKLGKNEQVAIDVAGVSAAVVEALKGRLPQSCRRSKEGNLTVSVPVKVEGPFLTKINASQSAKASTKKTDAEKAAEVKAALGL